jgi:hypothetical protein
MTKLIDKLTKEQEDLFPVYVDKWVKIGTATGPVDLEPAKKAVIAAYAAAGLPAPTQFFVAASPVSAIKLIQGLDPSKTASEITTETIYGYNDAYWISYFDYMQNVLGVKNLEVLSGLMDLASHCGWLNVYEDVVVFQDRPVHILMDEDNRLHSAVGPAILFSDGFSVYSWHGTVVPEEWINDPLFLTAKIALSTQNVEQRRCACEILGWTKILKELNSKVIDEDGDPEIGTLVEVDIPEIGKEKFLRVLCGTGREFALPVPPNMKTALEANAWTFGLDGKDLLNLEVRT